MFLFFSSIFCCLNKFDMTWSEKSNFCIERKSDKRKSYYQLFYFNPILNGMKFWKLVCLSNKFNSEHRHIFQLKYLVLNWNRFFFCRNWLNDLKLNNHDSFFQFWNKIQSCKYIQKLSWSRIYANLSFFSQSPR